VKYSRQEVADMLRKAGFREAAEQAILELPDTVDLEQAQEWGTNRGITRDVLVQRVGGSP
jgi:hypothetical protein